MPVVFIPTPLRKLSGGVATIDSPAGTIADIVAALDRRFPGMSGAIIEDGRMRPGVVAAVNGETTSWVLECVPEGAELRFLLAISGG